MFGDSKTVRYGTMTTGKHAILSQSASRLRQARHAAPPSLYFVTSSCTEQDINQGDVVGIGHPLVRGIHQYGASIGSMVQGGWNTDIMAHGPRLKLWHSSHPNANPINLSTLTSAAAQSQTDAYLLLAQEGEAQSLQRRGQAQGWGWAQGWEVKFGFGSN